MADGTVRIRLLDEQENILLVIEKEEQNKVKASGEVFTKISGAGLPGGKIRLGEDPLEAAYRELFEETGLVADIDPIPDVFKISEDYSVYLFHARNHRGEICPTDPNIITVKWTFWKFAYESVEYEGKKFPIYKRHLQLIHQSRP